MLLLLWASEWVWLCEYLCFNLQSRLSHSNTEYACHHYAMPIFVFAWIFEHTGVSICNHTVCVCCACMVLLNCAIKFAAAASAVVVVAVVVVVVIVVVFSYVSAHIFLQTKHNQCFFVPKVLSATVQLSQPIRHLTDISCIDPSIEIIFFNSFSLDRSPQFPFHWIFAL